MKQTITYLPVVVAVLTILLNVAINNYWGTNTNYVWWLTVIILVLEIGYLQYKLIRKDETTPNIVLKDFGFEQKIWPIGFYTVCAYIVVANEPKNKNGKISNSERLLATIEWFDVDKQFIESNPGRWLFSSTDYDRDVKDQTVDLPANGQKRRLHFTYSDAQKSVLESLWREEDGSKNTKIRGNDSGYYVSISLRDNQSSSTNLHFKITPQSKEAWPNKGLRLQQLDSQFGKPVKVVEYDFKDLQKFITENPIDYGM
ncbi:MAG: hypothetical protein JNM55_13340 [Anaerolineales bacterium]|nr:hypothetical protein [Anaerolineales bacterium]